MSHSWKVGDIIRVPASAGGFSVWRVVGIFLGATHQEGVVELQVLDRVKNTEGRTLTPIDILDNAVGVSVE